MTTVACCRAGRVDCCEHGTLHVTIGDVTLRMRRGSLSAIAELLATAERELALHEPATERPVC